MDLLQLLLKSQEMLLLLIALCKHLRHGVATVTLPVAGSTAANQSNAAITLL